MTVKLTQTRQEVKEQNIFVLPTLLHYDVSDLVLLCNCDVNQKQISLVRYRGQ